VPINAVTTRDKNSDKIKKKDKDDKSNTNDNSASSSNEEDVDEVVFVLQKDNTVKKVKVRTDIQDINNIEILSGLKEGDQVITGPYNVISKSLNNGDKVKVVPKEKLFETKET
jgi:HlyD family secretion protein